MSAAPTFIAKRSVRQTCREVCGRALVAYACSVPVAIWLGLSDEWHLAFTVATLGSVSMGIAIGASLVERKV